MDRRLLLSTSVHKFGNVFRHAAGVKATAWASNLEQLLEVSYAVDGRQFVALAAGNFVYGFALPETAR